MKVKSLLCLALLPGLFAACSGHRSDAEDGMAALIDESLQFSAEQYKLMAGQLLPREGLLPRSMDREGNLVTSDISWWTSGFFPGALWYLYEATNDPELLEYAKSFSSRIENEKYTTSNHDVGFMINCSFGNGLRITGDSTYVEVLTTAARSLSTRFRPVIPAIQSWNKFGRFTCPVIIDNMMNLELLFEATKLSGDSTYYRIAVDHANTTMRNHFRPDYTSYHVVDYDPQTGRIIQKVTKQGYGDETPWARGQGWALYGFTMCYRETRDSAYLNQAVHVADAILSLPTPEDGVPYWDFQAPGIPDEPRDVSAAALYASALIELCGYVDADRAETYREHAAKLIRTMSSPRYRAKLGENACFILLHGTGDYPADSEVDAPLTYADYYYIEALLRYKETFLKR